MSKTHTPTPWIEKFGTISGPGGFYIASVTASFPEHDELQEANAAFIVRAANSHEDLLALLKRAEALMPVAADCPKDGDNIVNYTDAEWSEIVCLTSDIRAAIQKAEA
jgi:hypothetical protein